MHKPYLQDKYYVFHHQQNAKLYRLQDT